MIRRLLILVLLTVAATPACAGSLDSLLVRHADAMGLSRERVDPGCWHVVEEISGLGLTGQVETWAQAPAAVRTRMRLGPLVVETWFDGQRGWLNDRNDTSREAVGRELEGMLVQALFSTGAWLLETPPVPLAFRRDDTASNDSTIVLYCQPLLEKPLRVDLDKRSHLPRRTVFVTSDGEQVQTFLEWGWHEGTRIATRGRIELAGLLTLDTRMVSVERLEPRPIEFYRPGDGESDAPPDIEFASAVTELELIEDGLHLTVQGWIADAEGGDVPLILLVDTGAGSNFLDAGAATRLGLEGVGVIPTLGVGGKAESSFVEVATLRVGDVKLLRQSWMASDFSQIRRWFEVPPSAVLGYDFLSRTVLEVDYHAQKIRIHDPGRFVPPDGAVAIPMRMDSNIPSIEIDIEGERAWVHVDTGSNGALDLAQPYVETRGLLEGRDTTSAGGLEGVGGTAHSLRGTVASVEIGGFRLEEVATGFNRTDEGIFSRDDVAGILGAELLSRFRCWFDYPGRTLWLSEP